MCRVTVEQLDTVLLVGALVLLVAVLAVRLSTRTGLPSLLIYLGIGLALGESGLGVGFDDAALTQTLGLCALVIILAEGGLTTRWSSVRPALPLAAVLATLGVAVSVTVVAVVVRFALDTEWRTAFLLGAVVSSTDAAAVFATLRRVRLRPRLAGVLEAESGLNDAPAVLLVTVLSQTSLEGSLVSIVGLILVELVIGAAVGLAVGHLGVVVLRRSALPVAGLYPLAALAFCVLAYSGAGLAHGSGFLAVYVAALRLGNARLPHHRATLGFAEGLAWVAQIGLFVLLGLLASPPRLPAVVLPALLVGAVLLLVARPLSVLACAVPFRVPWREQAFLAWAGLRGAVPIVLATIPLTAGLDDGVVLFDEVFVLVIVFTLLQGTSLPLVARRLGVVAAAEPRDLDVEAAPLEDLSADLLQVTVPEGSRLHGVEIDELRLPAGAAVTLVVRGGDSFVPDGTTRLRTGDSLLVVATSAVRGEAEQRLRAVSRRGRLVRWFGETGEDRAEV